MFERAYAACCSAEFDVAVELLSEVRDRDEQLYEFEAKAMPGMVLLSPEGQNGWTMLHWAAHHGDERAAAALLRFGAAAEQRDARGRSSFDLAVGSGHEGVAAVLRRHADAWSGWGITELSCLACIYHEDRFADGDAFLRRMIARDRARCNGPGATSATSSAIASRSIFLRPLPSGLRMVDIASRMRTSGTELLQDEYPEVFDAARAAAVAAAGQSAQQGGEEGEERAEGEEDRNDSEAAEPPEWPEDGWVPPCAGYMTCSLCKGKSGPAGRWGAGDNLNPSNLRYPLAICWPCQKMHGLVPLGGTDAADDGDGGEQELKETWVGTLLLIARGGYWGSRIAQLTHPVFGDVGH